MEWERDREKKNYSSDLQESFDGAFEEGITQGDVEVHPGKVEESVENAHRHHALLSSDKRPPATRPNPNSP